MDRRPWTSAELKLNCLARIAEARPSWAGVLPMVHALDVGRVADLTARTRSLCHEVQSEVEDKLAERGWRRVGLGVFWFYLLLTVAVLARLRRRVARGAPAHRGAPSAS